jgi:hypothetical protein
LFYEVTGLLGFSIVGAVGPTARWNFAPPTFVERLPEYLRVPTPPNSLGLNLRQFSGRRSRD